MNFDSGKTASTFFTFCGFDARLGPIVSTTSLASVHTEFSLNCPISSVMGSEVPCPQIEPVEQLDVDGVVNMFVVVGESVDWEGVIPPVAVDIAVVTDGGEVVGRPYEEK